MKWNTATVAALALVAVGCGVFTAPSQAPAGELGDLVAGLVRRGATITNQVSGDPGCSSQARSLHSNAVRYDVRPAGDQNTYPVFVFGWKSQAAFDADKTAFDSCVQSYAQSAGAQIGSVEHLPWRAFGPDWPAALKDVVDTALTEAGGIPAPPQPE